MKLTRLRTKIVLSFGALLVAVGAITASLVSRELYGSLSAATRHGGHAMAATLAAQLVDPLAYDDRLETDRLLQQTGVAYTDIAYVFVVGPDGVVVADSFPSGAFPRDLLALTARREESPLRLDGEAAVDIPAPILDGTLGMLHVGLSLASAQAEALSAGRGVLALTAGMLVVGIAGILLVSELITLPVRRLTEVAGQLGRGDPLAKAPVIGHDELAELARTFNEMAANVRERMAESEGLRAYLELVLDHVDSGIVVTGEDGIIRYANRTMREAHGVRRGDRCVALLCMERPCSACPAATALRTDKVLHLQHSTSGGRHYDLSYVPFRDVDGMRSVVETSLDLTEKRNLATRLQRAERLAVAGEIAAGVVHSINNPLDGMRRALALAARDPSDTERTKAMLSLASEGAERITAVTRMLLNLARVDEPSMYTEVSLNELSAEVAHLLELRAHEAGSGIDLDLDPNLPVVTADPRGVNEVLMCLVVNALDATGPGGHVVLGTRATGDGFVELSVADDRPGIAPEHLDRIFEPFFTTKAVGRGTGLGLPIARRMVEAHGGDISVAANPGRGVTFRVHLPQDGAASMTRRREQ